MAPTFTSKKGLRIGRALRSAAKLPSKVSGAKSGGGEAPLVIARVQILSAKDLLAKDKNGSIDPYAYAHEPPIHGS
jgi:phosphatidylserine decarboxylase